MVVLVVIVVVVVWVCYNHYVVAAIKYEKNKSHPVEKGDDFKCS